MDGVPGNLPSLLYAHKVQSKAASVGFDWDDVSGPVAKIDEELGELAAGIDAGRRPARAMRDELGDVLFAVVNVARHLDLDPESALRQARPSSAAGSTGVEELAVGPGSGAGRHRPAGTRRAVGGGQGRGLTGCVRGTLSVWAGPFDDSMTRPLGLLPGT